MADFVDEKRSEIGARLEELKPLVVEYARLQAAADALDSVPAAVAATPATRRSKPRAARPAPRRRGEQPTTRRGRPKGTGTRGIEALALVQANAGITIPELAEKMGIKQNYLYRVLPALAEDGKVTKDGRGWHPANTA